MCTTSSRTPARALASSFINTSLQRSAPSTNHAHNRFSGFLDRITKPLKRLRVLHRLSTQLKQGVNAKQMIGPRSTDLEVLDFLSQIFLGFA